MEKNVNILFYIVFHLILQSTYCHSQEMKDEVEKLIKSEFGNSIKINFSKYEIEKKVSSKIEKQVNQKFFGSSVYLYQITSKEKIEGYALLDNVYGKSLPITFIVFFDNNGNILSTNVLKYREQYGGSVKNPKWNEQFVGKNSRSSYEIGKEISSISGATISVNSVTKGIHKSALLIKEIIESGE